MKKQNDAASSANMDGYKPSKDKGGKGGKGEWGCCLVRDYWVVDLWVGRWG